MTKNAIQNSVVCCGAI